MHAKTGRLTFEELVRLEPRLGDLLARARAFRSRRGFCAARVWYGWGKYQWQGLRSQLSALVGWGRASKHPVLSGSEAYDVAYRAVYHALPDCRHESNLACL